MPKIQNVALCLALASIPGVAHAGTATATGTATLNVINQCSVTGAVVDLGTYRTTNTVGDVGADLGAVPWTGVYNAGTRGVEYVRWGSVTCDNGTPYTLQIKGTTTDYNAGAVQFAWQDSEGYNKKIRLDPVVKKIGTAVMPDTDYPGAGTTVHKTPAAGVGTGAPQAILGSAVYVWGASMGEAEEFLKLGTYYDTLSYTLNF